MREYFLPGLGCHIRSLSYDFETKTGQMDFPELNCCDMEFAIGVFLKIDPRAVAIDTFAGGKPDTRYRLVGGGKGVKGWIASVPKGAY